MNWVQGKHTAVSFKSNAKKEQTTKQKGVKMFPMYFPHLLLEVSIKSHVLWVSGPLGPATTHLARVHGLFSSGPQGPFDKGPGEITR